MCKAVRFSYWSADIERPCTHSGSGSSMLPCLISAVTENGWSAFSVNPAEKESEPLPLPVSEVENSPSISLTERPRSENPARKKPIPANPFSVERAGRVNRLGPSLLGSANSNSPGSGDINTSPLTPRVGSSHAVSSLSTSAKSSPPTPLIRTVDMPSLPSAPSNTGGDHSTSEIPVKRAESDASEEFTSCQKRKWLPSIVRGELALPDCTVMLLNGCSPRQLTRSPMSIVKFCGNCSMRTTCC